MFYSEIIGLNSVKKLSQEGKLKEALQVVLELEQGKDLSLKELLSYKLINANLLRLLGNHLDAIEIAKEIFQGFQEQGDLVSSFDALLIQAYCYAIMTNLNKSEAIIKQSDVILQNIKETLVIDLRERESLFLRIKATIFTYKGEISQSLKFTKEAYELAKDTGNKGLISASLNNIADKYYQMQKYDKALRYAKQALKVNDNLTLGFLLGTLIEIYVIKGNVKEAKVYLDHLLDYSDKFDSKRNKAIYHSSKALILKSSLRARDRIESEDLFKELALDKTIDGDFRIHAIINLCDLYLTELRITSDPQIINEIQPYIQELLDITENQHLYFYLAETRLLQAKLSLLNLDLKKAKQFLTQAQEIAELYGIKRLAMKISFEHDELLKKTKIRENLKISNMSLSERLELSGLNEQMENMVKRRMFEVPEVSKENPIMLLFLTEGGTLLFSKKFVEDFSFEDDVLGGILTTINYIINELFSEGLDRAVFGPYTLLMMPIQPFLAGYIFKGDSYFAYNKIKNFADSIQNDSLIWQSLHNFFQTSKSVQLNDIPSLESIVMEIFIEKENF